MTTNDVDLTEAINRAIAVLAVYDPDRSLPEGLPKAIAAAAVVVERRLRETIEQRLVRLAAGWLVGWDAAEGDPITVAYGEAWTTAARRLCQELVDLGMASKATADIARGGAA